MKILLDENLPQDFRHFLTGHEVFTVGYLGWKGLENGRLLREAEDQDFQCFITMDSGIPHQNATCGLKIMVAVLEAESNRLQDLIPLIPELLGSLEIVEEGLVIYLSKS